MGIFKIPKWLLLFLFCCNVWAEQFTPYGVRFHIAEVDSWKQLYFGDYSEVEFEVRDYQTGREVDGDNFFWEVDQRDLPPGLTLVSYSDKAFLRGEVQFVGNWCFNLKVSFSDLNHYYNETPHRVFDRVCIESEMQDNWNIPYLKRTRELPFARSGIYYNQSLQAPFNTRIDVIRNDSPFQVRSYGRTLAISGTAFREDVHTLVVEVQNRMFEHSYEHFQRVYQQFELRVAQRNQDFYYCPPGYYYSDSVGYCRPHHTQWCPDGMFFDYLRNRCDFFPTHPFGYCLPGTYYDHFLDFCVPTGAPRCPYGYRYSFVTGRCYSIGFFCPPGTRKDWFTGRCEYFGYYGHRRCNSFEYYDHYYQQCIYRGTTGCRHGEFWDARLRSCVPRRLPDINPPITRPVRPPVYERPRPPAYERPVPVNRPRPPQLPPRPPQRPVEPRPPQNPPRPPAERPVPAPRPPAERPVPAPRPPAERPVPAPRPPAERPVPAPRPPAERPVPAPRPPAERPVPAPRPPAERPVPAPRPPAERPVPAPRPPAERPAPPQRPPQVERPAPPQRPNPNPGRPPRTQMESTLENASENLES